jgi:DNA-binding NarL/FixJ family response regulator
MAHMIPGYTVLGAVMTAATELTLENVLAMPVEDVVAKLHSGGPAFIERVLPPLIEAAITAAKTCSVEQRTTVSQLAELLIQLDNPDSIALRANTLIECAFYCERIGKSTLGVRWAEAARSLGKCGGNINLERRACNVLGTLYIDIGNVVLAIERLDNAVRLARQMGSDFLEMAALSNVAALIGSLGLYQEAMRVEDHILSRPIDSPNGLYLRFTRAGNALYCAYRANDPHAGFRYIYVLQSSFDEAEIDPVARATVEYYRALYLIWTRTIYDSVLAIPPALKGIADIQNERVRVLLDAAAALYDWVSGVPKRVADAKACLRRLYIHTKQSDLYHEEILRALMEVYSRNITVAEVEIGMAYAKELIDYTTHVKRQKFMQQMQLAAQDSAVPRPDQDPLETVRAWLSMDSALNRIAQTGLQHSTAAALNSSVANMKPPRAKGTGLSDAGQFTRRLTPAELRVLELLCQGMSNKEIARSLNLAPGTIKKSVASIFQRLGARNRTEAVLNAARAGVLTQLA